MTTAYWSALEPLKLDEAAGKVSPPVSINDSFITNHPNTPHHWYLTEQDSRFLRYDVSPGESTTSSSDDGQDAFFSVEEDPVSFPQVPFPDSHSIYPVSDKLDPFESLPVSLNRFQEHLISSLSHENLSNSTNIGYFPSDTASISEPSINMMTATGFRVTLARSALDRLSQGRYQGEEVRKSLESAALRYKTDAVATIQALSRIKRQPHQTEELLEALIGLEKLEKKVGTGMVPSVHLAQLREVLRSSGGPLNIPSTHLSRLMANFECVHGTARQSYVWCEVDFLQSLAGINGFFSSIWMMWRSFNQRFALIAPEMKNILGAGARPVALPSFLKEGSTLRTCLNRLADGRQNLTDNDRLDLVCQLTSLCMLCILVLEQQTDLIHLQQCMDEIHELAESTPLGHIPNERIMWLLQSQKPEGDARYLWQAAEHVWLLKHVSYNVQSMIKEWLLKFLTGQNLGRCFKLDAFTLAM